MVVPFCNAPKVFILGIKYDTTETSFRASIFFIKQNPGKAHLSVEELQQMANNATATNLMSKISRYVGNITGTNAYWHKVRDDLKAIIAHAGPPTFFFTFSSADMHWPELHELFNNNNSDTSSCEDNRKNIIDNPHLADWYFTQRLETFVKYWLYKTLDADWHWLRYEYQARRGSIHCHGTAKLKNDSGLCHLTEIALKGFLAKARIQKLGSKLSVMEQHELTMQINEGQ